MTAARSQPRARPPELPPGPRIDTPAPPVHASLTSHVGPLPVQREATAALPSACGHASARSRSGTVTGFSAPTGRASPGRSDRSPLSRQLAAAVSRMTLFRLIRALPDPALSTAPRVLGVERPGLPRAAHDSAGLDPALQHGDLMTQDKENHKGPWNPAHPARQRGTQAWPRAEINPSRTPQATTLRTRKIEASNRIGSDSEKARIGEPDIRCRHTV
jgi:hypothetical protein